MKGHTTYVVKDGDSLSAVVDKFKSGELFPNTWFEVDAELTAEMVWNDHKNCDPYAVRWSGNMHKKNKDQMWLYPGELLYLPYLKTVIDVNIPNGIATHATFPTGDIIRVTPYSFRPIVDAHMHIQSLHATPMTLQWATTFRGLFTKAPFFKRKIAGTVAGAVQNDTLNTVVEFVTRDKNGALNGRKGVTGMAAALTNLGKIGRFSTDLVAKVYMNDVENNEMKQSLYWMLWNEEKIAKFEAKKQNMQKKAGEKLGLKKLVDTRSKDLQDFYKTTAYYFHKCQVLHMSIVMPMDLSYAHFWGAHGLPINLPVPRSNNFHYIDDFVQISVDRRKESLWLSKKLYVDNILEPANCPNDHLYHMNYNYNLKKELENYLYYMGYRCGLEEYKAPPSDKPFLLVFDYDILNKAIESKEVEIKTRENRRDHESRRARGQQEKDRIEDKYNSEIADIRKKADEDFKELLNSTENKYKDITEKYYKHYLNNIPDDNSEIFEDYYLQRAYTEASAFRYPLQLIPFYHYEPRRYYKNESKLKGFAKKIGDLHGFYKLTPKKFKHGDSLPDINQRAELSISALKGENGDYYLEMFNKKNKVDNRSQKELQESRGSMEHNDIPKKNKLYPNGCFMGVKVYPALGYPGDLYNWDVHDQDLYYEGQFDSLKEIYEHCIEHNLPITSHCSPLGMSISDGFNYEIRDDIKNAKEDNKNPIRNFHDVLDSALYVDKQCGRPNNWRRVLEKYNKLKLCLAHFGGMELWALTDKEREKLKKKGELKPDWRNLILELINDFDNVYTDISCYTMELGSIPEIFTTYTWEHDIISNDEISDEEKQILKRYYKYGMDPRSNIYCYILKVFNNDEKALVRTVLRKLDYINDNINTIGMALAKKLKEDKKNKNRLKERILMGSDWYMAEMSITGVGSYYSRMFELLKFITMELDDEYDVWHQFSVVNPLNYLGFLKESNGKLETEEYNGKEVYIIDIERVEKLLANLNKMSKNKDWKTLSEITGDEAKNFSKQSEKRLHQLKNCKIYTAEAMKKGDSLLITHDLQA